MGGLFSSPSYSSNNQKYTYSKSSPYKQLLWGNENKYCIAQEDTKSKQGFMQCGYIITVENNTIQEVEYYIRAEYNNYNSSIEMKAYMNDNLIKGYLKIVKQTIYKKENEVSSIPSLPLKQQNFLAIASDSSESKHFSTNILLLEKTKNQKIDKLMFAMEDMDKTKGITQHAFIIAVCENQEDKYIKIEAVSHKKSFVVQMSIITEENIQNIRASIVYKKICFEEINVSRFNKTIRDLEIYCQQNWVGRSYNFIMNNCYHFAGDISEYITNYHSDCKWFSEKITNTYISTQYFANGIEAASILGGVKKGYNFFETKTRKGRKKIKEKFTDYIFSGLQENFEKMEQTVLQNQAKELGQKMSEFLVKEKQKQDTINRMKLDFSYENKNPLGGEGGQKNFISASSIFHNNNNFSHLNLPELNKNFDILNHIRESNRQEQQQLPMDFLKNFDIERNTPQHIFNQQPQFQAQAPFHLSPQMMMNNHNNFSNFSPSFSRF